MRSPLPAVVFELPVWWVELYTAGLPDEARNRRREEIASDVYEQLHEWAMERRRPPAVEMAWATIRGIPDDLAWRTSQLTPGWWLAEFLALAGATTFCGIYAALAAFYITHILDGPPSILLGSAIGAALGIWMAVALRRFRPIDLSSPRTEAPADLEPTGDTYMPRTFRTWAGIAAIVAALVQVAVFGAYASGADLNPWAEPAEMLRGVDEHALAWSIMTIGTTIIPILLVPLFVVLATDTGSIGRQLGLCALVLIAIHAAINAVGFGLASQLEGVADAYARASAAEQASLLQQTDLVQHVWVLLRLLGGTPLALAMFAAGILCFKANVLPRWLGVVAIVLGLQFVPPVGGEFILEPPAMAAWALGAGFILVRGGAASRRAVELGGLRPSLPDGA